MRFTVKSLRRKLTVLFRASLRWRIWISAWAYLTFDVFASPALFVFHFLFFRKTSDLDFRFDAGEKHSVYYDCESPPKIAPGPARR